MNKYENKDKKNSKQRRNSSAQRRRRNVSRDNNIQEANLVSDTERLDATGRHNDPNWYFTDPRVADQASAFSFNTFMGFPTRLSIQGQTDQNVINDAPADFNAPSLTAVFLNPCPGDTASIQTGINMAALKTYTRLSNANAKTTAYAPQDVTMLILAIGELVSIVEHIRRAFGFAFTYNQRNRNLPKKVLEYMGFDADDFLKNLAQHRLEFNAKITAINQLPVLSNISYLHKCADLYQHVYIDSQSAMGQIVLMRPYSTWILDETTSEQGTMLRTGALPLTGRWETWVKVLDEMISGVMESATLNYIYSDILNFANKTGAKLLFLDLVQESYTVIPEYNRNFFLQFHNLNIVGAPLSSNDFTKFPEERTEYNNVMPNVNKNIVTYNPVFKHTEGSGIQTPIIDMDVPEANLVDRIEATRFMAVSDLVKGTDTKNPVYHIPVSLPDHYVVQIYVDEEFSPGSTGSVLKSQTIGTAGVATSLVPYFAFTQFDWAPLFYLLKYNGDATPAQMSVIGDLNYWTTLDKSWFRRVNDLSFMALFELR